MAFSKILVSVLIGTVAGQASRTFNGFFGDQSSGDISTTTPVPILKYIDQHNNDGSYTYGYESGDGTYKIETRTANGEISGKYGYYDENGAFKEITYGASIEGGFVPVVDGVEYSIPAATNQIASQPQLPTNQIVTQLQQPEDNLISAEPVIANRKFANFQPRDQNIKIVNGRRAVLKKRLRKKVAAPRASVVDEQEAVVVARKQQTSRQEQLRLRQEGLATLAAQRAALIKLQQNRAYDVSSTFPRAESPRSLNLQPQPNSFNNNPYVTGLDRSRGTYTISY